MVRPAAPVLVHEPGRRGGVDQLRERRAGRVAALHLAAERGPQPVVVGSGEAVLLAVHDLGWEQTRHRPLVQALRLARANAARGGDALHEAHQLEVEERHAQLEAGGHRHLVVAEQDPVRQEHVRVHVERLLEQAAVGHVAEDLARARQALVLRLARGAG